jgi:type I restriction enzyme S subunit
MTLPQGWAYATVGNVLEVNYGKGLKESARDATGHVPVYGSNGKVGQHSIALVSGPCLIIGRKGAAGAVHLSRTDCWPIDTTYWTRPPTELSLEYVYYVLRTLNLSSLDRSTAIPGLNRDDLYSQVIPIAPVPEQHRIVAEIEKQFTRLGAGVAALRRAQANLKRYKASVLKAACEGRLVSQDPNDEPASKLLERILEQRRKGTASRAPTAGRAPTRKYVEPAPPDTEGLPELPEGWRWTTIGSTFSVTIGGTPSRTKSEYWGGDTPWVSSGEVANRRIRSTREQITSEGLANSNAKLHPPGTVLLAMIGEGKTRGQTAILDVASTTNQNIASILCAETRIVPEWVFYWLMSRYEETRKSGSGGMQYALNSERIRGFTFPLPPLAEQRRIVAEVERRLSVVQEVEGVIAANLARAERLRQSILKQAFEGKLVPQDANDEPASVLLERIRAQRAEATPVEAAPSGKRARRTSRAERSP